MVQKDKAGEVWCNSLEEANGICPRGMIPTLQKENRNIWALFHKLLFGLIKPEGGYDYTAIQVVFDFYEVPTDERKPLFLLIGQLIRVVDKERQKRNEDKKSSRG